MNRVKKIIHTNYAYRTGLSGQNVTVVVMDTGIVRHPDFGNRILLFRDFCNGRQGLYDDNGHGTHVTGIIAGDGKLSLDRNGRPVYSGIAPRANMIMLKVLDEKGNGSTQKVLGALDWVVKQKDKYGIKLLNISVGMLPSAGKREQQELLLAVDEVWDAGIMVVVAAGNNGPKENSVTIPGISRKILTVGSSDDNGAGVRGYGLGQGYSGLGPTACCIVKPEILAPGTGITSCSQNGTGYQTKSGTSMAAPVVTGALALAFEKYPHFTPAEMKLRLYERAYPRGEALSKVGWGMIHVDNLVRGV
ncbi:MAG: S8 family peptidase [Clostridiales bacterium]|nr:S8 family peptidase [Clostridiales bacterium]